MTIDELVKYKESENKVEFKEAKGGNFSFNGGSKIDPKERRRCIVGYVTAFANEGGGLLVFGVHDNHPHKIVGTNQCIGATGKLEEDIYRETKIRVKTEELFDKDNNRVLIVDIPGRPPGKVYKFEDVPLMRVGEELTAMSDERLIQIIQEQEPDFSEKICPNVNLSDLDPNAILRMKEAYSKKQDNDLFLTLDDKQALIDLNLIKANNKITYAALILLGNEDVIKKHIPQSAIFLEYRNDTSKITFDDRYTFSKPYFLAIDDLWNTINLRNSKVPVQEGLYIFDIPYFNKEVIREAINNAIAHRDYRRSSEVVIKQYPQALYIISPGGFPIGVSLKNLLTVSSTPRNRLLADVLAKTGIVERSGQGVDKIFYQSISEGKGCPDYSSSDDFQVQLILSAIVKDKAFALFITKLQQERLDKLSVQEILFLEAIREGKSKEELDKLIAEKLHGDGLIEKVGKTNRQQWRLSKSYYSFTNKEADYTKNTPIDESFAFMRITQYLESFGKAKMGKFVELFEEQLTRDQVKTMVYKLSEPTLKYLEYKGKGTAREYFLGKSTLNNGKIIQRAIEIGIEEMKKRGEIIIKPSINILNTQK
jgi:ATP-dependent DNA helicase RecG